MPTFAHNRTLLNVTHIKKSIKALGDSAFCHHLKNIRPRIAACGDYLAFKHYYTVGKVRLTGANFCMVHLLCPLCAIRRGSKTLEAYVKRFEIIKAENLRLNLSMLTLTVKNGEHLQ